MEIADYRRRIDPTADTVRYHCKLRYRGATATEFEKKSFAVKLVDEAGEALDASLFNIRKENSWILDAMAVDRIRMRNRVCFDLWNDLSKTPYATNYDNRNGIEGVFVEVFVNGDYHGLYCLSDKIDRKLLGLKKVKVAEDSTVTVRGLLYKGRQWMDHTDIFLLSYQEDLVDAECWNGWELQYPDNYPSIDTWQPMMDLIDFCSQTTSTRFFRQHYTDYFYIDNLVDYFLLTVVMNVGDNAYKNTFLSTVDVTSSHRYLLTPWDMDMSLGGFYDGRRDESLADIHRYDSIAPFNRLYVHDIDRFRRRIEQKWNMLRFDLFSIQHVEELLDSYANAFVVSGAWAREYEKWNGNMPRTTTTSAHSSVSPRAFCPLRKPRQPPHIIRIPFTPLVAVGQARASGVLACRACHGFIRLSTVSADKTTVMPGSTRFRKYCHGFVRFCTVLEVLPRFCPVFTRFWEYWPQWPYL